MSTNTNTYIVAGVKLPYDFFSEEEYEDFSERGLITKTHDANDIGKISVIPDIMDSEWVVVGYVFDRTVESAGVGIGFFDLLEHIERVSKVAEVEDMMENTFGNMSRFDGYEPSLFVFTRYS